LHDDEPMSISLSTDDRRRIAEATRRACIEAALEGYESAAISGLCHEGAWENAISAIRRLDLEDIISDDPTPT
jgi:hypothetical protein